MIGLIQRDTEECGNCSGSSFAFWKRYPPFLLYAVAAVCWLYLLFGKNNIHNANYFGSGILFCFLIARTLRGSLHFLWRDRGRLTFTRVLTWDAYQTPVGLKGQSAVYMIVADIIFLPFCTAASAFRSVKFFRYASVIIQPNTTGPHWVTGVIPICGLLFNLIHWCVLVPMDRRNPGLFVGRKAIGGRLSSLLAAFTGIPTLSILSTVLPCDGDRMRFIADTACFSSFHSWSVALGALMFGLHFVTQDIAMGSLRHCGGIDIDIHRCDGLMLQLMMFHRCAYIFIAVFAEEQIWFAIGAFLSLFLLIMLGTYSFSSVRVLTDLTRASLIQCLLGSFCCSLTFFVSPTIAAWVWLILLLLSGLLNAVFLIHRYGIRFFEHTRDVSVMDF